VPRPALVDADGARFPDWPGDLVANAAPRRSAHSAPLVFDTGSLRFQDVLT
jgi:hypothetical protein